MYIGLHLQCPHDLINTGLLFDAGTVPSGWVRVGGVLLATFGLQYLGTGLGDAKLGQAPAGPLRYSRSFYMASVWSRLFLATGKSVQHSEQQLEWLR